MYAHSLSLLFNFLYMRLFFRNEKQWLNNAGLLIALACSASLDASLMHVPIT